MISKSNFAVHTFYYSHNGYDTMIDSLKNGGIEHIEFYAGAPHLCERYEYSYEEKMKIVSHLKDKADAEGIIIDSIFVPTNDSATNIADENSEIREFSVQFDMRHIDDAAVLGAKGIIIDSGWGIQEHCSRCAWDRSLASMKRIVKHAEEVGVEVYLRPMGSTTNIVNNLSALVKMIYQIDSPMFKACMDIPVLEANGEQIEEYYRLLPGKIGNVRISNYMNDGELCEGKGVDQLKGYIDILDDYEYDGSIGIEISWEHLDTFNEATRNLSNVLQYFDFGASS